MSDKCFVLADDTAHADAGHGGPTRGTIIIVDRGLAQLAEAA